MNKMLLLQAMIVFGATLEASATCTLSSKQSNDYTRKFIDTLKKKGGAVDFGATVKDAREITHIVSKNPHLACLGKQATKALFITLEQLHWSPLGAHPVRDISSDIVQIVKKALNEAIEVATAKLKNYVNEAFGPEITQIVMDLNDEMESAQELLQNNRLAFLEDFGNRIYESPEAVKILSDALNEDQHKKDR